MSYPGQGNQPPWQRNQMQGPVQGGMQNQMNPMGMQNQQMPYQNPQIFNQNMPMQQPSQGQNMSYGQMGANMNQMGAVPPPPPLFSQTVSYPNARGINSMAFSGSTGQNSQQGPAQQHQSMSSGGSGGHGQQQNAVGTVTKTHSDCGFVDDEVFFHKSVCKGPMPKVGERVLVEATFNQNSTFKWNATRIQIVSSSKDSSRIQPPPPPLISTGSSKSSVYSAVPPPNEYADQFGRPKSSRLSPSRRSPDRHRREARHREEDDYERKKRREERERERERHREKRELSPERRERSPVRRPSPKRRRTRPLPRYMVQIPKLSLAMTEADVYELRRRYGNMYVPSDFFTTHIRWPEYFPPHSPFSIHRPCSFQIMHKNVEAPKDYSNLDPPDADYLFSAKVMLMATPPISEIYEKCLQDENDRDEEQHFVHPTRLISFLVGIRGKNEAMAIGGPWSPSLDGENPDKDPTVLIKTAIRNCKVLTGVDLSKCTQWYRFVELYYHRPEGTHKGKLVPARTETVVIYLPDINSCMPTRAEWTETQKIYKATLERVLKQENPSDDNTGKSTKTSAEKTSSDKHADKKEIGASANGKAVSSTQAAAAAAAVAAGASQDEAANEKDESIKKEPTHHSELDPKTMKIQELRDELSARNLSPKGLKPQLIARLVKALRTEKSQEEDKNVEDAVEVENSENENADEEDNRNDDVTDLDMTDIVVLDEYDSTKNDDKDAKKEDRKSIDEKDRQYLERRYKLPESPRIIVHPSKTAKSGKFDCTIMSLSVLLDYRPEDAKEHSFEVSLFAELFNEMLMRDFGFNIYKELVVLPDKPKEEKKKDEKKADEKDSDEKSDSTKERAISRTSDSEKSDKKSLKDHDREKERSRDREKRSSKSRDRDRLVSKSRNRDDDSEDDDFSIISGEKRKKRVVAKPELLLSFVYFDTTHCGYIFEKDMEELLYALGLNLSRGQVRKILSKTILRDSLYYKKLTHKVNEEGDSAKEAELEIETKKVDLAKLAKGNKFNFPIFKSDDSNKAPPAKRARKESNGANGNIDAVSNNGLVAYNGGVLDVANMLEQMKRIEKEREESERTLVELKKQNNELSSKSSKAVTRIKDLQISTASLTRRLNDAEQSVSTLGKKCNEYYSLVSNIYDKITPVISKNDRILKNESSVRDKDREKERDKDKDKDKEREKDKDKDKEREKDKDKDKDKEREKDREKTREKDRDKEKGKEEPSKEKETDKAREKDRAKTREREEVKTAVKEVKENCTQDMKKEVSE